MNNFDSVARIYDGLSNLIFGKAIRRAQTAYLSDIRPGANVLVLGGGTGWLLSELSKVNPTCKVWYIDASAKMIELSKEATRNAAHETVFIHGTEDSIPRVPHLTPLLPTFIWICSHGSHASVQSVRSARSFGLMAYGLYPISSTQRGGTAQCWASCTDSSN